MRKKKIFNFHWLSENIVPPLVVLLLSSIAGSFMVERERAIGWNVLTFSVTWPMRKWPD